MPLWIIVCFSIMPDETQADEIHTESFVENYVSYPAFHMFSHLAEVDETRLDDVVRADILEELYWLMRTFVSL